MSQKHWFILIGIFLLIFNPLHSEPFFHAKFDSFLVTFTFNGHINYPAANASPRLLRDYAAELEKVNPYDFENWPATEQVVFWINAYNATVIQGILENYPLDWGNLVLQARFPKNSIYQIKNFTENNYIKIMGQNWSLKRIHAEIISQKFHDPRLFFTLVTGRAGDPPLQDRAYSVQNLEQQLIQQMKNISANPNYVEMRPEENKLLLASVFEQFQNQITPAPGWQKLEDALWDSLTRGQKDSVNEISPDLASTVFENAKNDFYAQKQAVIERLNQQISASTRLIDENRLELQKLDSMPESKIEPDSAVFLAASSLPADSLIQFLNAKLDSLNTANQIYQDSLKSVHQSEIDSLSLYQQTYAQILLEQLSKLPTVPKLNLSHYSPNFQGTITLLMQYAPESVRNFLRKNHPIIVFLPIKKELNEIVY